MDMEGGVNLLTEEGLFTRTEDGGNTVVRETEIRHQTHTDGTPRALL